MRGGGTGKLRALAVLAALTLFWPLMPRLALADTTGLRAMTTRDQLLGWEAVGRVEVGSEGFCTGTLIATDIVLTAAHCLYDPAHPGTLNDIATYRFRAGLRNDQTIAERRVLRAFAHPAYVHSESASAESIRHDVALLQLDKDIPAGVAAPFSVADLPVTQTEIAVVSFAAGREAALSIQRRCDITGRGQGLFEFDCDVAPGSSGAPVFDMSGGRGRIVSLISSGTATQKRIYSYGMELPAMVADVQRLIRRSGVGKAPAPDQASAPSSVGPAPIPLSKGEIRAGGARFVTAP